VNGAAPHLPALPSLLTAHVEPSGVSRWVLAGVAAALLGVGAWWLSGHTDLVADESNVWFSQVKALFAHNDSEQNDRSNDPTTVSDAPARETSQVATAPVAASPAVAAPVAQVPAASVPHVVAQPSARLPTIAATVPRSNGAATSTAAVPDTSPGARARIELAADNVEVAPSDAMARVIVHRSRSMRGDVSFSWWTESGTAKPGQDFVAVKSHMEQIENGKNAVSLLIPIVMDPARHQERNFYIVIDEPSDNAALGPRTLTMVTIPAAE
jgi:Calx-beta domain